MGMVVGGASLYLFPTGNGRLYITHRLKERGTQTSPISSTSVSVGQSPRSSVLGPRSATPSTWRPSTAWARQPPVSTSMFRQLDKSDLDSITILIWCLDLGM